MSEEFAHFLGGKLEISTELFGKFLGNNCDELIFIIRQLCPSELDTLRSGAKVVALQMHFDR